MLKVADQMVFQDIHNTCYRKFTTNNIIIKHTRNQDQPLNHSIIKKCLFCQIIEEIGDLHEYIAESRDLTLERAWYACSGI